MTMRSGHELVGLKVVLWFIGVALICAWHINLILASIALLIWGCACYWAIPAIWGSKRTTPVISDSSQHPGNKLGPRVGTFLLIVILSILVPRAYYWMTWDPTGDQFDNGWGWTPVWIPFSRYTIEDKNVPGPNGQVVTIRRAMPGLSDVPAVPFFVFVHSSSEAPSKDNLALRYRSTEQGWNQWPIASWAGAAKVSVRVGSSASSLITKRTNSIDGVQIVYDIDPNVPEELKFWERPFW